MQLLLNDKWKYEICFDKTSLDEVSSFCSTLKGQEKEIMLKEIEYYKTYFSINP